MKCNVCGKHIKNDNFISFFDKNGGKKKYVHNECNNKSMSILDKIIPFFTKKEKYNERKNEKLNIKE
jgi:hypothetical protein